MVGGGTCVFGLLKFIINIVNGDEFIITVDQAKPTKYGLAWVGGLIGLLLVISGIFLWNNQPTTHAELEVIQLSDAAGGVSDQKDFGNIAVDIAGAVAKPGVYYFAYGARIDDVLEEAGGLLDTADGQWVSRNLNRASLVEDGAKIYIPYQGEVDSDSVANSHSKVLKESLLRKVSINSASQSELESLWGIGEQTARAIIDGRPYQRLEELIEKKVLKENVWTRNKDQLSL